jgi:hypothetical protein
MGNMLPPRTMPVGVTGNGKAQHVPTRNVHTYNQCNTHTAQTGRFTVQYTAAQTLFFVVVRPQHLLLYVSA